MVKISVYLENGNVHEYDVKTEAQGREHAWAIIRGGYRSVAEDDPSVLTWWPPHQVVKVKVNLDGESSTKYFDKIRAT